MMPRDRLANCATPPSRCRVSRNTCQVSASITKPAHEKTVRPSAVVIRRSAPCRRNSLRAGSTVDTQRDVSYSTMPVSALRYVALARTCDVVRTSLPAASRNHASRDAPVLRARNSNEQKPPLPA